MKRELNHKVKLFINWLIYIPILIYGDKSWVMTKGMRSWIQAMATSFLHRVYGLILKG